MASVRTSIIGRPRRLSPHRRAHPATDRYTLICEEPDKFAHRKPELLGAMWQMFSAMPGHGRVELVRATFGAPWEGLRLGR